MRDWTVRAVIKAMFAAAAKQPVAATLAIYLLPALWMVPSTMAHDALVPADWSILGPGRPLRAVFVSWASSAWTCIWFAGQLSAAIDIVQGRQVRWAAFSTGLMKAPALFLSGLVATLPLDLLTLLPISPEGMVAHVTTTIVCVVVLYLVARTALWPPLIAAGQHSFWAGLRVSWTATRGHSLRIFALALVLTAIAIPTFIVEALLSSEHFVVTVSTVGALYLLAVAQLYSLTGAAEVPSTAQSVVQNPT